MVAFKDRTGESNTNKQGLNMKIIIYRNANDIDVEFEDGYISKNKSYASFKTGRIQNINYDRSNTINRVGEINYNKYGTKMEIINYKNSNSITIMFNDNKNCIKKSNYRDFNFGKVSSVLDKIVFDRGYIGIGKYKYNKKDKMARTWYGMFVRCYNEKYQANKETYKNCEVCEEWYNFQNFAKWYEENYYKIDDEVMSLDKDILVKGNKIYSPNTCVFVNCDINSLFTKCNKARGESIIGVTICNKNVNNKYRSQCSYKGGNFNLGSYHTEIEAFNAYKQFKEQYIKQIADEYKDKIPKKLYDAMYRYEVEITD